MIELQKAFEAQALSCESLGSAFMGRLLRLLSANWSSDIPIHTILSKFDGDIGPSGTSLPLRICGGLHALVKSQASKELASVYPPHTPDDSTLWSAVEAALSGHALFWDDWLQRAPQTNEVRRAAALIPATHLLATKYSLPIRISELGASAGLNLMFDQFALQTPNGLIGPSSEVTLAPDWSGNVPRHAPYEVVERRGVDLAPFNLRDEEERVRLLAYLWPDQPERANLTRAAIRLQDAKVDKSDAIDWLQMRLPHNNGITHLIYHTIAWQYFPDERQRQGQKLIEAAGEQAHENAPLAWLRMEADNANPGASLTMRLWPGDIFMKLARIDFHGRWIDWIGPTDLG